MKNNIRRKIQFLFFNLSGSCCPQQWLDSKYDMQLSQSGKEKSPKTVHTSFRYMYKQKRTRSCLCGIIVMLLSESFFTPNTWTANIHKREKRIVSITMVQGAGPWMAWSDRKHRRFIPRPIVPSSAWNLTLPAEDYPILVCPSNSPPHNTCISQQLQQPHPTTHAYHNSCSNPTLQHMHITTAADTPPYNTCISQQLQQPHPTTHAYHNSCRHSTLQHMHITTAADTPPYNTCISQQLQQPHPTTHAYHNSCRHSTLQHMHITTAADTPPYNTCISQQLQTLHPTTHAYHNSCSNPTLQHMHITTAADTPPYNTCISQQLQQQGTPCSSFIMFIMCKPIIQWIFKNVASI